jgi:hypothetical protein
MAALSAAQPQDTEAKIFYALSLAAAASPMDKTYANQLKAGAILESLFVKQPTHPGLAHYIIHSYDYAPLAKQAARAAAQYADIAPSAAHALHMPSHTFTRVGMWEESINTNRRSREVALSTGSISEALHAMDYSTYALLQLGRDSAAKALLDTMPAIAARLDLNAITGAAPGSAGVFAIAAIPARWALERRAWTEAAALQPHASPYANTEAMTYFARALGAAHTHDLSAARVAIDSLNSIQERLTKSGEGYWAQQVRIQRTGAEAWLALAERRNDQAITLMQQAALAEDSTDKSAVTPGPLLPARELLGDMYMELKRPADALKEYRATLEKEPNRFRALYGAMRSARLSGDRATAERFQAELRRLLASADARARPEFRDVF